tara:strand:- start:1568 stop:1813 length:246 start_codon:yes stop_codon:yes gene_type:complete
MTTLDPKQKVRRRIAKTCFGMIMIIFGAMPFFIIFGTEDMRLNITAVAGIIMSLLTFSAGIVVTWMGLVSYGDKNNDSGSN